MKCHKKFCSSSLGYGASILCKISIQTKKSGFLTVVLLNYATPLDDDTLWCSGILKSDKGKQWRIFFFF